MLSFKINIENAFRLILVAPSQWNLSDIFLSKISVTCPGIFNSLTDAVEWIIKMFMISCQQNLDLKRGGT